MFVHQLTISLLYSPKKAISSDWDGLRCPCIQAGNNFVVICCAVTTSLMWQCRALGKVPRLVLTYRSCLDLSLTVIRLDLAGKHVPWWQDLLICAVLNQPSRTLIYDLLLTFTFMHLAEAFKVTWMKGIQLISSCIPWETHDLVLLKAWKLFSSYNILSLS